MGIKAAAVPTSMDSMGILPRVSSRGSMGSAAVRRLQVRSGSLLVRMRLVVQITSTAMMTASFGAATTTVMITTLRTTPDARQVLGSTSGAADSASLLPTQPRRRSDGTGGHLALVPPVGDAVVVTGERKT